MTLLVAIHQIQLLLPGTRPVTTGHYDVDGNAIVHVEPDIIEPGQLFEYDDETEVLWLRNNGAVEDPSDFQRRTFGAGVGK
jgi:hypothetical protein